MAMTVRGVVASVRRRLHPPPSIHERLGSVGPECHLHGFEKFSGPEHAHLGANVHIGTGAFIRAEGGLTIGDNTHISRNLVLYTINHRYEGERLPYDDQMVAKPVTIGRNVWIGMNVCVAPGTTIGDGAIVGMGTVVFGEVPAMAIIGAAPWRELGTRDEANYDLLDRAGSYGGVDGRPLVAERRHAATSEPTVAEGSTPS